MHAGNIYSALCAWLVAKSQGGDVVLRIEDLDRERSRQEHADAVMRDFEALGLTWDSGPFYQHDRIEAYESAFHELEREGLVYQCFCTRAELSAQSAPNGFARRVYGGKCRALGEDEVATLARRRAEEGRFPAMRLAVPDASVRFRDLVQGDVCFSLAEDCGDFVVRRSDGGFAYQLAVVVDDADEGVSSVVRGCDLLDSTPQQIHLQRVLGLDTPEYAHVPLFCAPDGRRLAKRDEDAEYERLVAACGSPKAVLGRIAFLGRLQDEDEPTTPEELLKAFSVEDFRARVGGTRFIEFAL